MAATIKQALKSVHGDLMKKINLAMEKEVLAAVRQHETAAVEKEVYDSYSPRLYYRRGPEQEGLGDPVNMEIKGGSVQDGVMRVVNTTEPNPQGVRDVGEVSPVKNLAGLVEYGDGYGGDHYDFGRRLPYMKPRPFTERTRETMRESGAHIHALKNGLERRGLKVKRKK